MDYYMLKEHKDLLFKDLCVRLPYRVKASTKVGGNIIISFIGDDTIISEHGDSYDISFITPYLFPLSSITKEQSLELFELFDINVLDPNIEDYIKINECIGITFFLNKGFDVETHLDKLIDWLLKNHFDYRGLIEKGLALDATGLNIY